jgi:hypothetical protein
MSDAPVARDVMQRNTARLRANGAPFTPLGADSRVVGTDDHAHERELDGGYVSGVVAVELRPGWFIPS